MKRYLLLFFCIITIKSFSQVNIYGRITNINGIPIPYANIFIKNDSSIISGTISDTLGYYKIAKINKGQYYLCSSIIGYGDTCLYLNLKKDIEFNLKLKEKNIILDGVEIVVKRPTIKNIENKTIISFNKSTLNSFETTESILNYLPGMVKTNYGYKILGKGTPLILINGKISSEMELSALNTNNIIKIEMFDNDGSYDASKQYIINVVTKKQNNFLGGQLYNGTSYTTLFKNDFRVYLSVNKEKIQQSLYYKNNYGYSPWTENSINNVYNTNNDIIFNSNFNLDAKDFTNNNYLYYAINFDIDSNTYIGFQINSNYEKSNSDYLYKSLINNNTLLNKTLENDDYYDFHPSVNFNLTTQKKHNLSIICDYYSQQNIKIKNIEENTVYNTFNNDIKYKMSSVKIDYLLPIKKIKSSITFGGKFFNTKNDNNIGNINNINNNYLIEQSYAEYFNIKNKSIKSTFIQLGIRYEQFYREINDISNDSINKWKLNTIFPNFNITYKLNSVINISFNYLKYIDRSAYSYITNQDVYVNPYLYKIANPYLKPDLINSYSFNTTFFNSLLFQIGYKSHNNYTTMCFNNKDSIIIASYDNFLKQELFFNLNMTMQNNNSITNMSININKPFFKYEVLGDKKEIEHFNYSFSISNSISFAKKYKSEISIFYQPTNYLDLFVNAPIFNIDIGIKRFFFNKSFRISLYYTYNHINKYKMQYKQIELLHEYTRNKNLFFISFLYNFNFNKKWINNKNSLNEEINRIN